MKNAPLNRNFATFLRILTNLLFNLRNNKAFLFSEVPFPFRKTFFMKKLKVNPYESALFSLLNTDNSTGKSSWIKDQFQIEKDIPRCHQYHPIINSYYGKKKLLKVIRSWYFGHQKVGYFQGLDSIAFVCLEIAEWDEPAAHLILEALYTKHLSNLVDSSGALKTTREQSQILQNLIAFFEPGLYLHLKSINFTPELYSVPWIVNLFSSKIK